MLLSADPEIVISSTMSGLNPVPLSSFHERSNRFVCDSAPCTAAADAGDSARAAQVTRAIPRHPLDHDSLRWTTTTGRSRQTLDQHVDRYWAPLPRAQAIAGRVSFVPGRRRMAQDTGPPRSQPSL